MVEHFAERDSFALHSDHIDVISFGLYASFINHLISAIPPDKLFFSFFYFESPVETQMHHCRHDQLQASVE